MAIWKTSNGQRFQNYRAVFTTLDAPVMPRKWIEELAQGAGSSHAPKAWRQWVDAGRYSILAAEPTTNVRSVEEQVPDTPDKRAILHCVWSHFKASPVAFEAFAARVYQMTDQRVIVDLITRGAVDGGRDAIGRYLLGIKEDPVYAEFALEAKCYRPSHVAPGLNPVGVSEVSRLISRLRHRQFGVLVTTSAIGRQAYQEVREDRHPVIFISGRDIAEILIRSGYNTVDKVNALVSTDFGSQ